jgi:hypothetical protein
MSRNRQPLTALALIAMLALISGCGSSAPANTGGGGDSALAKPGKAAKFASCMRKNGVSQFPDPPASGNFTIDEIANGSSLDTNSPAFTQALSACKALEPSGFTGSKRSTEQQHAALKFAQCMRANGVSDFPDPVNGQPLVDTNRIPSANQPGGMSALKAAMQKCSHLSAAAGVTR